MQRGSNEYEVSLYYSHKKDFGWLMASQTKLTIFSRLSPTSSSFLMIAFQVGKGQSSDMSSDPAAKSPWTGLSQFLPTTQKIVQFSNTRAPSQGDKIVYVSGNFDLFHIGTS